MYVLGKGGLTADQSKANELFKLAAEANRTPSKIELDKQAD